MTRIDEIEGTKQRIRFIEADIDWLKGQATIGPDGDAVKRAQLHTLETRLGQQKRKLARLEQNYA